MDHDLSHVRALFDEVIQARPEARAALLDLRCGSDTALRRRIEALIATAEAGEPFLADPTRSAISPVAVVSAAAMTERPGTRIGPFKLLQVIGEGGFGVVFMADQDHPVRRRVALKVIKLGMDTRQVVARFEQERQALALMDHPHIARVLDAGSTESGRPYFVMEYVKGDPITAFADAHKLSVRDRLELFAQVCAAVQHAHTKGVIHRDLKPRNVLVSMTDGKPFAKVIDFGIAKATGARLTDKTLFTEHRQLIGTPEYMSPEQAEGSPDIDTRTDVYSLGVLLYELLTGATPFDGDRLRSAAWGEMQRIIKEEDPPAPSVRISRGLETLAATAAARAVEPARLSGQVHGELDWIVMKALDKDRARRYESPSQFAADVQRHLAGEAVVAAPASAGYRLRKFVRRNKGPVMAGSAVAAALVVGMAGTVWGLLSARTANEEMKAHNKETQAQLTAVISEAADLGLPVGAGRYEIPGYGALEIRRTPDGENGPRITVQSTDPQGVVNQGRLPLMMLASTTRTVMHDLVDRTRELDATNTRLLEQTQTAERAAYTANLALAQSAMDADNWPEARERLDDCPESQRGWEWRFLHNRAAPNLWQRDIGDEAGFAAVMPDGRTIIAPVAAGDTQLWDASVLPPKQMGAAPIHISGREAVSISPDGAAIAVGGRVPYVFNTAAKISTELPATRSFGYIFSAVFSPDGRRLAIGANGDGERLSLWDVSTASPRVLHRWGEMEHYVGTVSFSPDGRSVLAAGSGATASLWDITLDTPRKIADLEENADHVSQICFSHDGRRTAMACYSAANHASVWDLTGDSPRRAAALLGHTHGVEAIAWSHDDRRLLTASYDGSVRLWSDSGVCLGSARLPQSRYTNLDNSRLTCAFSEDDRHAIIAYNERIIALDVASFDGGELRIPQDDRAELALAAILGPAEAARLAALPSNTVTTPDGLRRISAGADGVIRFFEHDSSREVAQIRVDRAVKGLRLTADGARLVITFEAGPSEVWDTRDLETRLADRDGKPADLAAVIPYIDALLAGPVPTGELLDHIKQDQTLPPARRLAAAELLAMRTVELEADAERALRSVTENQTERDQVRAAARTLDLPPRVKELLIARADAWEYDAPRPSADEKLAQQAKLTDLARSDVLYERFSRHWELSSEVVRAEARKQLDTVIETRTELLGPGHIDTVKAIWARAMVPAPDAGDEFDSLMERAAVQLEQAGQEPDAFLIGKYAERAGAFTRAADPDTALRWVNRLSKVAKRARETGDDRTTTFIKAALCNSDPGGEWSSGAGPGLAAEVVDQWLKGDAPITRAHLLEAEANRTRPSPPR